MNVRVVVASVAIAALLCYVAGYWPESTRRAAAEQELASTRISLVSAQAHVAMGRLLVDLLGVADSVAASNYGEASQRASSFFDSVRSEAGRSTVGSFQTALQRVLQGRDAVTAALARTDPSVAATLQGIQRDLREAMLAEAQQVPVRQ